MERAYDPRVEKEASATGRGTAGRREPRLDMVGMRLAKSLDRLMEMATRVDQLADRICGPIPASAGRVEDRTTPDSAAGKLEVLVEDIDTQLNRLVEHLQRLETL